MFTDDMIAGQYTGNNSVKLQQYSTMYYDFLGFNFNNSTLANAEVRKIAESLIALAVKEKDNFETVEVTAKVARKDKDGNFIGFSSQRRFSQNAYVIFDADELGNFTWKMIPLDLGMDREIPLRRGIPAIADPEEAQRICDHLNDISAGYGTRLVYDKEEGCIRLA